MIEFLMIDMSYIEVIINLVGNVTKYVACDLTK